MNALIRRTARLREAGPHGIGRGNRLLRRGSGITSPADLPGIAHWWSADDLALDDNDPVTVWTDSIGSLDVAPGAAGTEPVYKAPGIGGLPALEFDGVDAYIARGSTPALSQPFTLAIVADGGSTTGTQTLTHLVNVSTGITGGNWFLFGGSLLTAGAADTDPHLHIRVLDGASSAIRIDDDAATTGAAGSGAAAGITIGAGGPGSELFTGRIAQVILCAGVLSASMQAALYQWAQRYGV